MNGSLRVNKTCENYLIGSFNYSFINYVVLEEFLRIHFCFLRINFCFLICYLEPYVKSLKEFREKVSRTELFVKIKLCMSSTLWHSWMLWWQLSCCIETFLYCIILTLFRMGFFGAAHGWGGPFWLPLPKICHIYPTMMKLGIVIPYQRKTQKMYKSRDKFLEFC